MTPLSWSWSATSQPRCLPFRLVIVEDDDIQYKLLKRVVHRHFSDVRIVGHCESVGELIEHIAEEKPDILLADVQIHGGTCFDAFRQIEGADFDTIVLSVQSDFRYAQEALRLGAADYLVKPFSPEELVSALQKVIDKRMKAAQQAAQLQQVNEASLLTAEHVADATLVPDVPLLEATICVPHEDGMKALPIADIGYVKAEKHYVVIHDNDGNTYRHRAIFSELANHLEKFGFVQCHKSHLVALKYISKLIPEFVVINPAGKCEKKIPMARSRSSMVKQVWRAFHAK